MLLKFENIILTPLRYTDPSSLRKHLKSCAYFSKGVRTDKVSDSFELKTEAPNSQDSFLSPSPSQPYHCHMSLDNTLEFLLPDTGPLDPLSPFSYSPLCPSDSRTDHKSVGSSLSYLTSGLGSSLVSDAGISRPYPFSPSSSEYSDIVSEASFRQDPHALSLPPISRTSSLSSDTREHGHTSGIPELPKIRRHSIIPTSRRYRLPPCSLSGQLIESEPPGCSLFLSHMDTLSYENESFGLSSSAAKLHGLRID